jgi:uncharacterized membrane protein (TIGR02234 family)
VIARLTSRRWVVLLALAGALLVLLAGTRTWATVNLAGGTFPGVSVLTVAGRRSAPEAIAIALAAAAGAVVLATSGRVVRFLVAGGLLLAGAAVVVSGVRAATDHARAVAIAVQDSLHLTAEQGIGGDGTRVDVPIWPWVAVAGGGLVLLAGLLALLGGRFWSGPTRRYEQAATDPPAGAGPAGPADPVATAATPRPAAPAATWDALSRGEDPTSTREDPT